MSTITDMAGRFGGPMTKPLVDAAVTASKKMGQPNVAVPDRIASGVLGAVALAVAKRQRDGRHESSLGSALGNAALMATGSYLIARGTTGHCLLYHALRTGTLKTAPHSDAVIPHGQGIKVESAVTIDKPVSTLYGFWRELANLPDIMTHLESVTELSEKRSHWVAKAPFGKKVSWDAEILEEIPDQKIVWRSLDPADIPNAGTVRFVPMGDRTEIKVTLEYNPPAGTLGAAVAHLAGQDPQTQIDQDLKRFKERMEAK